MGWSRGPRFGPPLSALSSTVHLSLSLSLSPSFCLSLSPSSSKPRRVRRAHTHELQLHRARAGAQLGVAPAHQTIPAHFALLLASTERARTRLQSSPLTLSLVGSRKPCTWRGIFTYSCTYFYLLYLRASNPPPREEERDRRGESLSEPDARCSQRAGLYICAMVSQRL